MDETLRNWHQLDEATSNGIVAAIAQKLKVNDFDTVQRILELACPIIVMGYDERMNPTYRIDESSLPLLTMLFDQYMPRRAPRKRIRK